MEGVIETNSEFVFLAPGKLGLRSQRLAGGFTLTRPVGQISPANGTRLSRGQRPFIARPARARRGLA
jgi:hypothetical protein